MMNNFSIFAPFDNPKTSKMKKRFYIILVLALISFTGFAQEANEATPVVKDNPNAPEMKFETEVHDYGTIKQGSDGSYDFKFTNLGKDALIISNARGSCGCTVPTWPKEPIKNGASSAIKVHYDTNRVGAFTKTVTITSNAKNPTTTITIKGNVEAAPKEQTQPFQKVEDTGMPFENNTKPFSN